MTWRASGAHNGKTVNAGGDGPFDELVVERWFHLENMDKDVWWMRVGDLHIDVIVANGKAVRVELRR